MLAYWGAYHTQGPDMRQCQEHTMPGMDLREHAREVFPIIQRRLHIPGPKDLGGGQDEWPARQTGHWAHASPGLALEPHSGSCLPPACLSTVPGSVPSPGQAYAPSSHSTQDAYRHHVDAMVPAVLQHHHGQGRALSPGPQTPSSLYTSQMKVKPCPLQGSHAAMLVLRLHIVSLTET